MPVEGSRSQVAREDRTVITVLSDTEQQKAISVALRSAGCEFEDLRAQAQLGRFTSDAARRAWLVVSSLG